MRTLHADAAAEVTFELVGDVVSRITRFTCPAPLR
jgi:hypothetical protein